MSSPVADWSKAEILAQFWPLIGSGVVELTFVQMLGSVSLSGGGYSC